MIKTVAWRGRLIASTCVAVALLGATALKPVTPPIAEMRALISDRPSASGVFSASVLPTWRKFPLALGHTRSLAANRCNGCAVAVSIVAVEGAKLIDADAPPPQTQLVAWISNLGGYSTVATDKLPSFRPSSEATYAEIADRDPTTGKTRWQILEFRVGGDQAVRAVASGIFRVCHRYIPDPARQSEADLKACTPHISNGLTAEVTARLDLLTDSTKRPRPPIGGWISCNGGCCT